MRVIVIGSGIAGLSAAIALGKVGIEAVVYERAPELREVGAGISLWANAFRALDYLGVGNAVRARAFPLAWSEIRAKEGRKILAKFTSEPFEDQLGIRPLVGMIHRADLVAVLAGLLSADTVRFAHECIGVEEKDGRVTVRFANGHTDTADAVIGADGIRSAVRRILFGEREPRYAGYTCWRGIAPRPATVEPGYMGEWWGRGKRFGIATLPDDRVYWFAVHNALAGRTSAMGKAEVADLFQGWADPVAELIGVTPAERIVHGDILDRPPLKTWSQGRIGLMGDASHPTTPNLGQGGCMAIEDAVVLARCLKTIPDPGQALASFTMERYKRTSAITKESWQIGRIAHLQGRLSCVVRDGLLGLLMPVLGARSYAKHAKFDVGGLELELG